VDSSFDYWFNVTAGETNSEHENDSTSPQAFRQIQSGMLDVNSLLEVTNAGNVVRIYVKNIDARFAMIEITNRGKGHPSFNGSHLIPHYEMMFEFKTDKKAPVDWKFLITSQSPNPMIWYRIETNG
jgi:hypothetical protein